METQKQEVSDEDIPSDFFDDFNKDEFIEGLSVIDSWDVEEGIQRRSSRTRIDAAAVVGVRDLRELIRDGRDDIEANEQYENSQKKKRYDHDSEYERHYNKDSRRERSSSRLDNYIKPGSRRDLRKTNEAIKKDKQVKVKEYLSKHLDSIDDLKPPGTELDDFLNEPTSSVKRKHKSKSPEIFTPRYPSKELKSRESPRRQYQYRERRSIHHSPHRPNSPHRPRFHKQHYEPHYTSQYKNHRYSPNWRARRHYSPSYTRRRSRDRRSPIKQSSPWHSPRGHRSPSPIRYQRSGKHSPPVSKECKDTFLYPNEPCQSSSQAPSNLAPYQTQQGDFYSNSTLNEYPGEVQGYSYVQGSQYSAYSAPYTYGRQKDSLNLGMMQPAVTPILNSTPVMVPAPHENTAVIRAPDTGRDSHNPEEKPFDALAKLVLEGKISKEDYLKLAPAKGTFIDKAADTHVRVKVLNRCNEALNKLSKLALPNRLLIDNALVSQEAKSIAPKYCSPLKRQATVDFYFTKTGDKGETEQQNRQLIDSIISTLGLSDIVLRSNKRKRKGMKDAAVQTTKSFCDVCQIRDATKTYEIGTSIELEDFTSTVHTQVVEQDLISSKAVFNPTGSVSDGAPISIAHLTPAQLVSQLAARAKTLKQTEVTQHSQFIRRNPENNYEGRPCGNQYNYNYRF